MIDKNWNEILEDFTDYNDYNDEVFGGDGGSGIVNVNNDTVIPWTVNGNNQIVVDVKPYISVKLAAELGNTPIAQQGQGGVSGVGLAIGNFNATTREITILPAYTDLGASVINSLVRSAVQINGVNLPIVAGYAELLGNFFPASLGEKMLANTYEKYRLTAVKVQTAKSSATQTITTACQTVHDDVQNTAELHS